MPRGQTEHLKAKQFKQKGDQPLAKVPLTVRVDAEIDAYIRSQPDRNKWLQRVIREAVLKEAVIKEAAMACRDDTASA